MTTAARTRRREYAPSERHSEHQRRALVCGLTQQRRDCRPGTEEPAGTRGKTAPGLKCHVTFLPDTISPGHKSTLLAVTVTSRARS